MISTPALKRYNRRVIWLSIAYVALLVAAIYGFNHDLIPSTLKYVVAILPALPIVGIFVAIGRYLVEEPDEYVRMLMVRQTLWASGFALSLATVWGFLESFDMVGHIDAYYVAVLWFAGLGLGGIVNKLTLGEGGC
jgi:hypothetical protein